MTVSDRTVALCPIVQVFYRKEGVRSSSRHFQSEFQERAFKIFYIFACVAIKRDKKRRGHMTQMLAKGIAFPPIRVLLCFLRQTRTRAWSLDWCGGRPARPSTGAERRSGGGPARPSSGEERGSGVGPDQARPSTGAEAGLPPARPSTGAERSSGGGPARPSNGSGGGPARPGTDRGGPAWPSTGAEADLLGPRLMSEAGLLGPLGLDMNEYHNISMMVVSVTLVFPHVILSVTYCPSKSDSVSDGATFNRKISDSAVSHLHDHFSSMRIAWNTKKGTQII